jgi:hypothetical protein
VTDDERDAHDGVDTSRHHLPRRLTKINSETVDIYIAGAVAQGRGATEIARELGCSREAVTRRAGKAEVREMVDQLRRLSILSHAGALGEAAGKAIERLKAQIDHNDPWVAQKAACSVMDYLAKLNEHLDLEARVERLTSLVEQLTAGSRAMDVTPRPGPGDDPADNGDAP